MNKNPFRQALAFDDVIISPQYSEVLSRYDDSVKTDAMLGLKLPIVSAPMDTVTGPELCIELYKLGGLGTLHRYCTIEQQLEWVKQILAAGATCAVAIGATGDAYERYLKLLDWGIDIFCIDIAHGDHLLMHQMLKRIRKLDKKSTLIAGNIATPTAACQLAYEGADIIRTSVGSGATCTTRIATGCGMPTLQAVMDIKARFYQYGIKNKIMADGGVKTSGDVCKALAAGADLVMCGSMFAGTDEAAGEVIEENGVKYKAFSGMASERSQLNWGRTSDQIRIEGASGKVKCKGPLKGVVKTINDGLRSAMSYVGAFNLEDFYYRSQFVQVTNAGQKENGPHGL